MADSKRIRTVTDECKPPDGGFGWVVALGSFIVFVVIGGQAYSFGVLYVEFLDAFGASKASTAWIGALYFSPGIVSFPLSMALINKYGYRTVAMIGGILSSIGLFATSFATSIGQIYFIYGIFTGLWHWFLLLPALAIIRRYFTNRLPLALGFALSGTGAGQFVVSFTAQVLVDEYDRLKCTIA
ncbi:monocarboxylate transporter 13-like [Glandiceps talaboti]